MGGGGREGLDVAAAWMKAYAGNMYDIVCDETVVDRSPATHTLGAPPIRSCVDLI
jgi:hypothetical protein